MLHGRLEDTGWQQITFPDQTGGRAHIRRVGAVAFLSADRLTFSKAGTKKYLLPAEFRASIFPTNTAGTIAVSDDGSMILGKAQFWDGSLEWKAITPATFASLIMSWPVG